MTDPNGTRLEGISVRVGTIHHDSPLGMGGAGRATVEAITEHDRTTTDGKGWYEMLLPSEASLAVTVEVPGFLPFRRSLGPRARILTLDERGRRLLRLDIGLQPGTQFAGRVVDQDGKPVAGADARFEQWEPATTGWAFERFAMSAKAGAEGRFRIESARPSGGLLFLSATGYASVSHEVSDPAENRDWVLSSVGGTIAGRVVMKSTGKPVPGVRVEAWRGKPENQGNDDNTACAATTDQDGRFRIEPLLAGIWDVTARTEAMRVVDEGSPMAKRVVLGESQVIDDIVLTLGTGWNVSGIVVNAVTGEPVEGAIVSETFWTDKNMAKTVSDAAGGFTLENLFGHVGFGEGPNVEIKADKPGLATIKNAKVSLKGDAPIVDVRIEMVPEVEVSGVVRDDKGRPVAAQQVRIHLGTQGTASPSDAFTDHQGRFVLRAPANASAQVVAVVGELSSYSEPFDIGTAPVSGIVLNLDPGGELVVKCTDESGKPAGNLTIWMMRRTYAKEGWSSSDRYARSKFGGEGGELIVRKMPSTMALLPMELKRCSVDVGVYGSDEWADVEERGIEIAPRETKTVILKVKPKDATHFIDGVVLDWKKQPVEGAVIQAWSDGGDGQATTDALGAFRFEKLSPGKYRLDVSHATAGRASKEVPADTADVEIVLGTDVRWRATVLDDETGKTIESPDAELVPDPAYPVESLAFAHDGKAGGYNLLPGKPRRLIVTAPGYESLELEIVVPEGQKRVETEIRLRPKRGSTGS